MKIEQKSKTNFVSLIHYQKTEQIDENLSLCEFWHIDYFAKPRFLELAQCIKFAQDANADATYLNI